MSRSFYVKKPSLATAQRLLLGLFAQGLFGFLLFFFSSYQEAHQNAN
jgi:hypothetical protein